jgi:hypothetical protein
VAIVTPAPRIGRYAASTKNPRPKNSERQPRNANFVVASAKPSRKPSKLPLGLINR